MASVNYEAAYCPKIQAWLNAYCSSSSSYLGFETGTFDAITSEYNNADWNITAMSEKKPLLELLYQNRPLPSSVTVGAYDLCPTGAENPYLPTTIELDPSTETFGSLGVVISDAELKNICIDNKAMLTAKAIYGQINAVKAKINDAIITAMASNIANSYGPTAPQVGPPQYNFPVTLINTNGQLDISEYGKVMYQMRLLGCSQPPILIGNGSIYDCIQFNRYGCCNSNGIVTSDITGQAAYYLDPKIGVTAGLGLDATPYFVGLVPGAVNLVYWNPYTTPFVDPKGNETGVVVDPATGVPFTYRIRFTECTNSYSAGEWTVSVHLLARVVFRPADYFAATDPLFETNGMLVFKQV